MPPTTQHASVVGSLGVPTTPSNASQPVAQNNQTTKPKTTKPPKNSQSSGVQIQPKITPNMPLNFGGLLLVVGVLMVLYFIYYRKNLRWLFGLIALMLATTLISGFVPQRNYNETVLVIVVCAFLFMYYEDIKSYFEGLSSINTESKSEYIEYDDEEGMALALEAKDNIHKLYADPSLEQTYIIGTTDTKKLIESVDTRLNDEWMGLYERGYFVDVDVRYPTAYLRHNDDFSTQDKATLLYKQGVYPLGYTATNGERVSILFKAYVIPRPIYGVGGLETGTAKLDATSLTEAIVNDLTLNNNGEGLSSYLGGLALGNLRLYLDPNVV